MNGVQVPPYLPEKEKIEFVTKILEGEKKEKIHQLPDPAQLKSIDSLVSFISVNISMEKMVILLREQKYNGNFGDIIKAFVSKKANFQLFELPDFNMEDQVFDFLCCLRECMVQGHFMIVNIDPTASQGEFGKNYELTDVISLKFLNGNTMEIIEKFRDYGIPEPDYIHPHFILILCGSQKVKLQKEEDLGECKIRILKRYPFLDKIGSLSIGVIKELENEVAIYETDLLEDSYNFENQLMD